MKSLEEKSSSDEISIAQSDDSVWEDIETRLMKVSSRDRDYLRSKQMKKTRRMERKCPARELNEIVTEMVHNESER